MALAGPECLAEVSGAVLAPPHQVPPCLGKQLLSQCRGPHLTRTTDLSALICFNFPMSPDEFSSGGTKICQFSVSSCYRYWGKEQDMTQVMECARTGIGEPWTALEQRKRWMRGCPCESRQVIPWSFVFVFTEQQLPIACTLCPKHGEAWPSRSPALRRIQC